LEDNSIIFGHKKIKKAHKCADTRARHAIGNPDDRGEKEQ
jgi:hypothetical protein